MAAHCALMTQLDKRATVRHRRLATELRKLREARGLGLLEAAEAVGWSRPKLSKYETAARRPTVGDVEALLDLYGCDAALRLTLVEIARNIGKRGWWLAYSDVWEDTSFLELEDDAVEMRTYQRYVVPGMLQTDEYAMAVMKTVEPDEAGEIRLRRAAARAARRRRLSSPDAPVFHAVIEESVLRRPVGGMEIMNDQYRQLLAISEFPNVQVQVMPQEVWQHPAYGGSFVLLGFGGTVNLDVVYIEGAVGNGAYLEDAAQVEKCRLDFAQISKAALPDVETVRFIEGLLG